MGLPTSLIRHLILIMKQTIFENKGLENQQEYDKKYFWGTINEEEVAKVKEGLK